MKQRKDFYKKLMETEVAMFKALQNNKLKTPKYKKTYNKIRDYFKENPESKQKDAAKKLGVSNATISNYLKEIRKKEEIPSPRVVNLERMVLALQELLNQKNKTIKYLRTIIKRMMKGEENGIFCN